MSLWRVLIPALSTFVALSLPGVAGADVEREGKTSEGDYFEFKDDPLHTLKDGPMGDKIRIRLAPYRVQLIRPRTHFVPEMFKSVEHI
jgi:hypothetical protein